MNDPQYKIPSLNQRLFNQLILQKLCHQLRNYFLSQNFLQGFCPPVTTTPCFEAHVHPIKLQKNPLEVNSKQDFYLATSVELQLKKLFLEQSQQNPWFSLDFVFRDDPLTQIHRKQFLMLEWYQKSNDHQILIHQCSDILQLTCKFFLSALEQKPIEEIDQKDKHFSKINHLKELLSKPLVHKTLEQLFLTHCQVNLKDLSSNKLFNEWALDFLEKGKKATKELLTQGRKNLLSESDLFNYIFLNEIEPFICASKDPFVIISGYPHLAGGLAKSQEDEHSKHLSQRMELFVLGHEIANGCVEETDLKKIKSSIEHQLIEKKLFYGIDLPNPSSFYESHLHSLPQPYCGMALGVERLASTILGENLFLSSF